MVKFGNFEVEYIRNAPDKVSVRIETDDKGRYGYRNATSHGRMACLYSR